MRLRYLPTDYFTEASNQFQETYLQFLIAVPHLRRLSDCFLEQIQAADMFLFDVRLVDVPRELQPELFLNVNEVAISRQFLSEIVPVQNKLPDTNPYVALIENATELEKREPQVETLERLSTVHVVAGFVRSAEIETMALEMPADETGLPLCTQHWFDVIRVLEFSVAQILHKSTSQDRSSALSILSQDEDFCPLDMDVVVVQNFPVLKVSETKEEFIKFDMNLEKRCISPTPLDLLGQTSLKISPAEQYICAGNLGWEKIWSRFFTPQPFPRQGEQQFHGKCAVLDDSVEQHWTRNFYSGLDNNLHTRDQALSVNGAFKLESPVMLSGFPRSLPSWDPGTVILVTKASHIQIENLCQPSVTKCFETHIVLLDLRLDDSTFRSLLPPALHDQATEGFQILILDELFRKSNSLNIAATDWLYLDWHGLQGTDCNSSLCFHLQTRFQEVELIRPDSSSSGTKISTDCLMDTLKLLGLDECVPLARTRSIIEHKAEINCTQSSTSEGGMKPTESKDFHSKPKKESCKSVEVEKTHNNPSESPSLRGIESACMPHEPNTFDTVILHDKERARMRQEPNTFDNVVLHDKGSPRMRHESNTLGTVDLHDKERASIRHESNTFNTVVMPNDLDYFLQARKGMFQTTNLTTSDSQNKGANELRCPAKIPSHEHIPTAQLSCVDNATAAATPSINIHDSELTPKIVELMEYLSADYDALLQTEEIFGEENLESLNIPKDLGLDTVGNRALICISSTMAMDQPTTQPHVLLKGIFGLLVLRHTAWNLCTYGIQVAHLYLENFVQRMHFLEGWIQYSRTELEEAYNQVENCLLEDHKKLKILDHILNNFQMEVEGSRHPHQKILLLANSRVYFTFFNKLASLNLKPYQVDRHQKFLQDGNLRADMMEDLRQAVLEALSFSDCVLIPYVYLTEAFPLERFSIIIQYAEPDDTQQIEKILGRVKCVRHLLKAPLWFKGHLRCLGSAFEKLSPRNVQGIEWSQRPEKKMASCSVLSDCGKGTLLQQNCNMEDSFIPTTAGMRISQLLPVTLQTLGVPSSHSRQNQPSSMCTLSRKCEMTIVANISEGYTFSLTSRISSYQKIVSLEKDSLQVVERELRLPIDLILNTSTCLVLYTMRKLQLEPGNVGNPKIPLVEIIDRHMKAIGYSYRNCILIFEGPKEFTSTVVDAMEYFYTSAIEVNIHIQCFVSERPEVTDTIIMNCIQAVRESKKILTYPLMAETPSIAEVFITEFPSVNPLTANVILARSSLAAFIAASHEKQMEATQDFDIPVESLTLFKTECVQSELGATFALESCIYPEDGCEFQQMHRRVSDNDELREPTLHLIDECLDIPDNWNEVPYFPPQCFFEYQPESDRLENPRSWSQDIFQRYLTQENPYNDKDQVSKLKQRSVQPIRSRNVTPVTNPTFKFSFPLVDECFNKSKDTVLNALESWLEKKGHKERHDAAVADCAGVPENPCVTSQAAWGRERETDHHAHTKQEARSGNKRKQKLKPSTLDSFRYERKASKQAVSCKGVDLRYFYDVLPAMTTHGSSVASARLVTPDDKRSPQVLGCTKRTGDSQKRLIWQPATRKTLHQFKRSRLDTAVTL